MFEVSMIMLTQLIDLIPAVIGIYILFDLMGSLLFGRER